MKASQCAFAVMIMLFSLYITKEQGWVESALSLDSLFIASMIATMISILTLSIEQFKRNNKQ